MSVLNIRKGSVDLDQEEKTLWVSVNSSILAPACSMTLQLAAKRWTGVSFSTTQLGICETTSVHTLWQETQSKAAIKERVHITSLLTTLF